MSTQTATPEGTQTATPERPRNNRVPLTYNPDSEIVRAEHWPLVTGLSNTTLWRYRRADKFVPVIQLGENSIGARRTDLQAWLASKESK
jgi:predicted DNA-binding transcriptional regulator AlpA